MSEHTKGPLHVGGNGTILYAEDGWAVANATVFHGRHEPDESQANARRLAACWNACAGIPTDVLEDKSILKADAAIREQRDQLQAALSATVEQRDRLLEALKGLYLHTKNNHSICGLNECARAAIANIERQEGEGK